MTVTTRRKVRSGCGTCRIRRVKCDELKPVCRRCYSTGRTCEGYGIWGGGGNGYAERYGSKKTCTPSLHHHFPATKLNLSDQDQGYLDWFHHRLVHDLSGRLAEGFWTALVMPMLLNEPVIAHAAIALSSAHKNIVLTPYRTQRDTDLLVTKHYNESLRHLRSAIELGGKTTSGFVVDPDQAKIMQGFASLHLESQFLGTISPGIDILVQSFVEDVPSRTFKSIEEARYSLNKLVHAILLISRRFLQMNAAEREVRLGRLDIHNQALCLLQDWLNTYKSTNFCETTTGRDCKVAHTILLNHYEMALIMWGHIGCTSETDYSVHIAKFLAILEHSAEIWHLLPSSSEAQSTSAGDNLATPLFFTALKCRDRRIRLQAVRLLNTIPFGQGGWSCMLMSKIAAGIVALEQGASTDPFLKDGFDVIDTQSFTGVESPPHTFSKLIHDQWTDDGGATAFYHDIVISR
ncbi:hypothetical protein ACET3X_007226 [Alternaria dauci]|uniref:Zn(2)-C6 fungal-type domain-containing protein n=1 Tax=Alternaria dauci TaxID=48095 RepID=A0ABR3UCV6_9PLEO